VERTEQREGRALNDGGATEDADGRRGMVFALMSMQAAPFHRVDCTRASSRLSCCSVPSTHKVRSLVTCGHCKETCPKRTVSASPGWVGGSQSAYLLVCLSVCLPKVVSARSWAMATPRRPLQLHWQLPSNPPLFPLCLCSLLLPALHSSVPSCEYPTRPGRGSLVAQSTCIYIYYDYLSVGMQVCR